MGSGRNPAEATVADVMTTTPTVLHGDDRMGRAAREMEIGLFRHLPVVDRRGHLVGLVSHRDVVGARARPVRVVADAMQTDVKTVGPETPAHEAAYLLLRHKIGCVPVVDAQGRLVGIVTESDFVRVAYSLFGGRVPVGQLELEEDEANRV